MLMSHACIQASQQPFRSSVTNFGGLACRTRSPCLSRTAPISTSINHPNKCLPGCSKLYPFLEGLGPTLSQGHTTILTVVDKFSKACRLILLLKLPSALEMVEQLCNCVFHFHDLPEDIVLDRDLQFTSHAWGQCESNLWLSTPVQWPNRMSKSRNHQFS